MTAIQIEGLVKTFGDIRALDGLTLSIEAGSVFGFLGPNGAGKTTTIRILTGLARATAGRAWVDGVEVTAHVGRATRHVGYLPQDPAFYPWMTGQELLDYVGRTFGLPSDERHERTKGLLALTGLTKAARRRVGGYSGGMRQRLGIAQALVNRPSVLLLDEPVSSLDPVGRKELLVLIERLRGQCTVVVSTHILADVERVCDTVGIIDHGRLVIEAKQDELLARYAVPAFELEAEEGSAPQLAAWAEAARAQSWVASVSLQNHTARVVVRDIEAAKQELLTSALGAGLVLVRYAMVKPSLEDVFMQLVSEGGDK
jgi:ABC-2 type transport system ATP-binding protein